MSDLADLSELENELEPTTIRQPPAPEQPPLSSFEFEVRQRLANMEARAARGDTLIIEVQADIRRLERNLPRIMERALGKKIDGLSGKVGELVQAVRDLIARGVNGHG